MSLGGNPTQGEVVKEVKDLRNTVSSFMNGLLDTIYPVGSIRLSINAGETGFMGGNWVQVGQGRALFGAGTLNNITYTADGTKDAGLPNIAGTLTKSGSQPFANGAVDLGGTNDYVSSGALGGTNKSTTVYYNTTNSNATRFGALTFDASKSNAIYGNSTTVQPNAYVVYAYKRISGCKVTFPSSVNVYLGQESITSGSEFQVGTQLRVYSSKSDLIYLKANGQSIQNNSTITLADDTTITISYKETYGFGMPYRIYLSSSSNTTIVNLNQYGYNSQTDTVEVDNFQVYTEAPDLPREEPYLMSSYVQSPSTSVDLNKMWLQSGTQYIDSVVVGSVSVDSEKITITCTDTSFRGSSLLCDGGINYSRIIVE